MRKTANIAIDLRGNPAAELFARVVQLEHRGTVLGDHSSGSVMESIHYPWHRGVDTQFYYGASITEADLVMSDGKSLEHTGVISRSCHRRRTSRWGVIRFFQEPRSSRDLISTRQGPASCFRWSGRKISGG